MCSEHIFCFQVVPAYFQCGYQARYPWEVCTTSCIGLQHFALSDFLLFLGLLLHQLHSKSPLAQSLPNHSPPEHISSLETTISRFNCVCWVQKYVLPKKLPRCGLQYECQILDTTFTPDCWQWFVNWRYGFPLVTPRHCCWFNVFIFLFGDVCVNAPPER